MSNKPESYWQPQVLRHISKNGTTEYAIHEVHYFNFGKKWGPTENALSSKFATVADLKKVLQDFIKSKNKSLICGDQNYEYFREDIKLWLDHIDDPIKDYPVE